MMQDQITLTIENPPRVERLSQRLSSAKRAFTTRNADLSYAERLIRKGHVPKPGDIVLARVKTVGQHVRIENIHGRRGELYPGDEVVVAYGNRYAPDQFEARMPLELSDCDLVAGGGIASQMVRKHDFMKSPTRLEVIGLLASTDKTVLNVSQFALRPSSILRKPKHVFAVVGSSMNAGKTTTAAGLIHGLSKAGFNVGAAKLTGTGSGGDLWTMRDAGANVAVDFTDAGHASTSGLDDATLGHVTQVLLDHLAASNVDIAIVEIADGLLQSETAGLIGMAQTHKWFDGYVFAAADAMGSVFGLSWLSQHNIVPRALSGLISASPLAAAEATRETNIRVATLADCRNPQMVTQILFKNEQEKG